MARAEMIDSKATAQRPHILLAPPKPKRLLQVHWPLIENGCNHACSTPCQAEVHGPWRRAWCAWCACTACSSLCRGQACVTASHRRCAANVAVRQAPRGLPPGAKPPTPGAAASAGLAGCEPASACTTHKYRKGEGMAGSCFPRAQRSGHTGWPWAFCWGTATHVCHTHWVSHAWP